MAPVRGRADASAQSSVQALASFREPGGASCVGGGRGPSRQLESGRQKFVEHIDRPEAEAHKPVGHRLAILDVGAVGALGSVREEVIIAGAFGSFLNVKNAIAMGLFPELPNARYRQVGNAAAIGAKWILISRSARLRAQRIAREVHYLELTTYPKFNRKFAQAMLFPEKTGLTH